MGVQGGFSTEIQPDGELCIFSSVELCEVMGFQLMPQRTLKEYRWVATWMSKVLRHSGNRARWEKRNCKTQDPAYGIPMDSGAWHCWGDIGRAGREALAPWRLPDTKSFC